jgi:hypothetical protein
MSVNGNQVTIRRRSLPKFVYQGVIQSDGTVTGTSFDGESTGTWRAVIRRTKREGPAGDAILGRVWEETEGGWRGTWTRRGDSNVFDAAWTGPNGEKAGDILTMTLNGNRVTIRRHNLPNHVYTGVIGPDGQAEGTANDGRTTGPWKAVIRR